MNKLTGADRYSTIFHRVTNRVAHPFGLNVFPRAFNTITNIPGDSSKVVFDKIFETDVWGSDESKSGVGSERKFADTYLKALDSLIVKMKFKSVFDAPCGDLNWMIDLVQRGKFIYEGGDISTAVLKRVRNKYPQVSVKAFDITSDPFPKADLWHCRDCLFHLPEKAIFQALENFAKSEIPYVLFTSHRARFLHKNLDVNFGGFRLLDLERPPFNFPKPIARLKDYRLGLDFPRYVGLWERKVIEQLIFP